MKIDHAKVLSALQCAADTTRRKLRFGLTGMMWAFCIVGLVTGPVSAQAISQDIPQLSDPSASTQLPPEGVPATPTQAPVDPLPVTVEQAPVDPTPATAAPSSGLSNTQVFFIYPDHINTPRAATDNLGNVVWRWDSDAFGAQPPDEDPGRVGNSVRIDLRFPGQVFDRETNLHYNYLRDYDPAVGRYVQSDPIGLAGGLNTYTYAQNAPNKLIDPTGELAFALPAMYSLAMSVAAEWALPAAAGMAVAAAMVTPGDTSKAKRREEKQSDYARYKQICDEKTPPGLDKCEEAKARKDKHQRCYSSRESYTNRWFDGDYDDGHAEQMAQRLQAIRKAERDIQRYCKCP